MKRKLWTGVSVFAVIAMIGGLLASSVAYASGQGGQERLLIFTDGDEAVNKAAKDALETLGGRSLVEMRIDQGLRMVTVLVPAPSAGPLRQALGRIAGVLEVSPDVPPELLGDSLQWGVDRIDADKVWSDSPQNNLGTTPRSVNIAGTATITGAGVKIAVVDTGIDLSHPDLAGNLDINGDTFVNGGDGHANCIDTADDSCSTALPAGDGQGHGSHVAGIAAAGANGLGVVGVAPRATLLSVKIFDDAGGSSFAAVVNGIRYVAGRDKDGNIVSPRRADVMNMSFGWSKSLGKQCPSCVTVLQTVVDEAWGAGVVPVAAAGNSGTTKGSGDNIGYPARLDNVLAVGATDKLDKRASFSSTGAALDLAAPGVSNYSTYKGGQYATLSGTSMASPHVAGSAALVVQSLGSSWSNSQVVAKLTGTADDLGAAGKDSLYGYGLVDAAEAATGTP